jgi:hypothetical protein
VTGEPTPAEWDEIIRQDLESEREQLAAYALTLRAELDQTQVRLEDVIARLAAKRREAQS